MTISVTDWSEPTGFQVTSGKLRVTDPCYNVGTWCSGETSAKIGLWTARFGYYKDPGDTRSLQQEVKYLQAQVNVLNNLPHGLTEEEFEAAPKNVKDVLDRYVMGGLAGDVREMLLEYPTYQLERYTQELTSYKGRVSCIVAGHESFEWPELSTLPDLPGFSLTEIHVGVDSGQAGLFDSALYPANGAADEAFYDKCCDLTLGDAQAGSVGFGIVSSSGYGDGGYNCFVKTNTEGEVVGVAIVYICHGEDEDTEDDASTL